MYFYSFSKLGSLWLEFFPLKFLIKKLQDVTQERPHSTINSDGMTINSLGMTINAHGMKTCSANDEKFSGNDDKCSGNDHKYSENGDKSVLCDPYEFFTILNY